MTQKAFMKIQNGVLTFFGKKSDIVKKCIEGNTFFIAQPFKTFRQVMFEIQFSNNFYFLFEFV